MTIHSYGLLTTVLEIGTSLSDQVKHKTHSGWHYHSWMFFTQVESTWYRGLSQSNPGLVLHCDDKWWFFRSYTDKTERANVMVTSGALLFILVAATLVTATFLMSPVIEDAFGEWARGWGWPWFCFVCKRSVFFSAVNPRVFSHEKHKFEKFIRNYHNQDVLEKTAFKVLQWKNDVNLNNKTCMYLHKLFSGKERIPFGFIQTQLFFWTSFHLDTGYESESKW